MTAQSSIVFVDSIDVALAAATGSLGEDEQRLAPGRVCRTGVSLAPEVTETIIAYDKPGRTLTYQATAGMPDFVTVARRSPRRAAGAPGCRSPPSYRYAACQGSWPGGCCWPRPAAPDGMCSTTSNTMSSAAWHHHANSGSSTGRPQRASSQWEEPAVDQWKNGIRG